MVSRVEGVRVFREPLEIYGVDPRPCGVEGCLTVYIIEYEKGKALVVDPGPSSSIDRVKDALEKLELTPTMVLLTHIHLDHGGGVGDLVRCYRDLKVLVHPRGVKHLRDPSRLWKASVEVLGDIALGYGEPVPVPDTNLVASSDGQVLELGRLKIKVLFTPGHASHHQCFIEEKTRLLFSGDAAGMFLEKLQAYIPATPPPFDYDLYMDSLNKLKRELPHYIAFPHNTIKMINELLDKHETQVRLWMSIIYEHVRKNNLNNNDIIKAIAKQDENARKALESGVKLFSDACIGSIIGMIKYAEKRAREKHREREGCLRQTSSHDAGQEDNN